MDKYQIQTLLAKYFEGNTTLEEESILHSYFSSVEVDPELLAFRNYFDLLGTERNTPDVNLDALNERITDQILSLEDQEKPVIRRLQFTKLLVAASLAVIISITGLIVYKVQNKTLHDTYNDPKLAYMETQKTLLYISGKINQGIEPLSNVSKINTATENLQNLEKMDKSMSMLNLVSFINKSSNLKK